RPPRPLHPHHTLTAPAQCITLCSTSTLAEKLTTPSLRQVFCATRCDKVSEGLNFPRNPSLCLGPPLLCVGHAPGDAMAPWHWHCRKIINMPIYILIFPMNYTLECENNFSISKK